MEEAAMDIFLPCMESAVVLAAHYAKAAGRDCILAQDIQLGLMYAARNVIGKQIGTLYPEIYEESDTDDEDEGEESDEEEPEWTAYEGTDNTIAHQMNECAETWDAWEPETPAERALKNAVDKQRQN